MDSLINKYSELMDSLYETIKTTDDKRLEEFTSKSLIDFINGLYYIEKKNKESYENLLEKYNLGKDKLKDKEQIEDYSQINNLDKYKNELENIFKNPNEESIKVWLKNIISYAKDNNINDKDLNKFIMDNFKVLDKENKYTDKLDKYILEINEHMENNYNKDDEVIEDNNKNKSSNEESKPLKILNVKKSFNSKVKNKGLTIAALTGLGVFMANPLFGAALGISGYYLYKKGISNAKKLIENNGYSIDNNDNLIDKDGKIVTNDDIGKIKYNLVRRELNKISNGNIDKNYKKNRLTSLLLNNSIVKGIRKKYETIKSDKYESPQLVKDINQGMRKV